ncbi:resistance protein [Streptomyces sp. CB09001]|uniref:TerD family protein n=1 Tax=Streptomyces sp. CB09001 TaxID=2083284 RepID=UPI000E217C72|nr:TerD family protein [Streptomyces sp. CB09001]AXL88667.1 resistance protein [Streptomyces sp. CB09001]
MTQMTKGGNLPVPAATLQVAVTWRQGAHVPDVDVSALLLDAAGRVRSDADLVFYNQPAHPSGAVRHLGKGRGADGTGADWLWLDLAAVELGMDRVVVAASTDAGTFGQVPFLDVRVALPDGRQVASFTIGDASTETAFVFGEFYRRNGGWKFRAVGQGYASGLAGLATDFGISVAEDPQPVPMAPAPAPPPPLPPAPPASYAPPAAPSHAAPSHAAPVAASFPAPPADRLASELALSFPPFTHHASGKERVTCPPNLPPGARVVVEIACRDSISVNIDSCDAYGRADQDLLSTYEDDVHARTFATVPKDRPLSLLVRADTPWTLRVLPLAHARRLVHSLDGRGPDLLVYEGPAGVLSFVHQGRSNFVVWHYFASHDPEWEDDEEDLLVNEVGLLDVLAPVQAPGILRIEADGPWRIGVGG